MTELAAELLGSPATADFGPLVSQLRRRQILALAERLPLPVRAVGYECRLGSNTRVDYNFAFFAGSRQATVLAELAGLPLGVVWQRVLSLLQPWAAGNSALCPLVPFVCAAFDEEQPGEVPPPCLSLCVDPEFYVRRLGKRLPPLPPTLAVRVAEQCAASLDEPLAEPAREALLRFLSVEESVEARHLSIMAARPGAPMKLDLRLPLARVQGFLNSCGLGQRGAELATEVAGLLPGLQHVQLNLPLDTNANTTLEVEVLSDRMDAPATERLAFLDRLVERGHAVAEKVTALKQIWHQPLWSDATGRAVARSWYVKLRFQTDGVREAKVYLGLLPHGARLAPPTWRDLADTANIPDGEAHHDHS